MKDVSKFIENSLKCALSFQKALEMLSQTEKPLSIKGLSGALKGFFIAYASSYIKEKNIIAVASSEPEAEKLKNDILTASPESEVFLLPTWGTLLYRGCSIGAKVFSSRAQFLSELSRKADKKRFFIVTLRSFVEKTIDPLHFSSLIRAVKIGEELDVPSFSTFLISVGYTKVSKVDFEGAFSVKGEVIDIYVSKEKAFRIRLDFDKVSSINYFDSQTRRNKEARDFCIIPPRKEILWSPLLIKKLEEKLKSESDFSIPDEEFSEEEKKEKEKYKKGLIESLKNGGEAQGEELYYPLLWDDSHSILDFSKEKARVFFVDYERSESAYSLLMKESENLRKRERRVVSLPFSEMFFPLKERIPRDGVFINSLMEDEKLGKETVKAVVKSEPSLSFLSNVKLLKEELLKRKEEGSVSVIFAKSENQSLRIKTLLKDTCTRASKNIIVTPLCISEGFSFPEVSLYAIAESEIFKRKTKDFSSVHKAKSRVIDNFVDLNQGDYVVHTDYGIGIFKSIERVKTRNTQKDYIKIEYANEDFVFVPIEQLDMVHLYIGNEGKAPSLDKIGSASWQTRKNKVKKSVEEMADKLLTVYSRRKAMKGFAFEKDGEWQAMFEGAFPYEETADQITASAEIKEDMEKEEAMDRLLCGDVGYGKTEVAMRACFKAVMSGKQVAFLSPTTVLASQHFDTFRERFRHFPVSISLLSRTVLKGEQKKILQSVKSGETDILIGTHRIIQKDVLFRRLGFLVIDEEQRFGVKDKEKLKALKENIDCLSLSATPIPRTLNSGLLKIRDMSLLATAPLNRKPVETFVEPYSDEKVKEAIRKEVARGGQVFFLHNRIESLEEVRLHLARLLPEILIESAHGRMKGEELEEIFIRFKNEAFNVLLSTTIIENGIDIPNVNTIIIDRADMYGISQLYQLRGRVGRSERESYAYLFYPEGKSLSDEATKRLKVISDFTELGSGFKIAMKDLEIRGAGNLLGKEQSGNVYSVGFELYMHLLNEAISRLTESELEKDEEVRLEMDYSAYIPDSYIASQENKMEVYKRIAQTQSEEECAALKNEITERYGKMPVEGESLFILSSLKAMAKKAKITSIKERNSLIDVTFSPRANLSIDKTLSLIRSSSGKIKLDPKNPLSLLIRCESPELKEKAALLSRLLSIIL